MSKPRFQRIDVACRLCFVAEVDSTLLEHGTGFTLHILEQQALNLLKKGKRDKDFHLSVITAMNMAAPKEQETQQEKDTDLFICTTNQVGAQFSKDESTQEEHI